MKQALNRQQIFSLGAGLLMLLAAAGLGWFGVSGLGEKQTEAQALADRMGDPALGALLADGAGMGKVARDVSEMQKLENELQKGVGSVPAQWAVSTRVATGEGEEWAKDPGKWKDQMIAVVSRLQKTAAAARVQLAPDFYLGLDAYRQKSPTVSDVPALALHLSVAQRLVEKLFEARKTREQYATICEIKTFTGPGAPSEKPAEAGGVAPPARPGVPTTAPERKTFRMEILCSPEVLYEYVRLLSTDEWLFLVKDLAVSNQKQSFPPRSEIAKKFSLSETPGTGGEADKKPVAKKLLEILAGDEGLSSRLEIEFVSWKNPESSSAPKTGTKP